MKQNTTNGKAYWACAAFTLLSAIVSACFSLLSLRMADGHEFALYAASRSIALPVAVLYAITSRSQGGVATMAVAMTLIQCLDGLVGLQLHDPGRTYGPFGFAVINAGLLLWMRRSVAVQM